MEERERERERERGGGSISLHAVFINAGCFYRPDMMQSCDSVNPSYYRAILLNIYANEVIIITMIGRVNGGRDT